MPSTTTLNETIPSYWVVEASPTASYQLAWWIVFNEGLKCWSISESVRIKERWFWQNDEIAWSAFFRE